MRSWAEEEPEIIVTETSEEEYDNDPWVVQGRQRVEGRATECKLIKDTWSKDLFGLNLDVKSEKVGDSKENYEKWPWYVNLVEELPIKKAATFLSPPLRAHVKKTHEDLCDPRESDYKPDFEENTTPFSLKKELMEVEKLKSLYPSIEIDLTEENPIDEGELAIREYLGQNILSNNSSNSGIKTKINELPKDINDNRSHENKELTTNNQTNSPIVLQESFLNQTPNPNPSLPKNPQKQGKIYFTPSTRNLLRIIPRRHPL